MSTALRAKVVSIFCALFEVFVLSTEEISGGRVKAYFKSLIGAGSPVEGSLEKLKKLTLGEERQVLADTYGGVSRIDTKTDRVEEIVTQVNEDVKELRAEYKKRTTAAHQDKLRELLQPSPFPEDYYSSFDRLRVDGTGDWIIEDDGVQAWVNGGTPYMWMSGGPGTGKSFLATRLISWGNESLPHVSYFYFRSSDPETRSVLQALRDVAYQLSESDAFYGKQLARIVRSTDDIKTIPGAFRELFVQPFENDTRDKKFHVFLDGIDEAEMGEVEELLIELAARAEATREKGQSMVQICLVGRSYLSDVVNSYLDPPSSTRALTTVLVTPERNAKDVKAYIEASVAKSRVLSRSTPELRQQVIELMEKRVDGLFILAKFMVADVNSKRRPNSILQALESFPREINGMLRMSLSHVAETISEEEVGDLNEILIWVFCAEQALTLEQLEAVLILKYDEPPFRFEDSLRGQYASFFELEREDGLTTDDLVKDYERVRREERRSSTPNGKSRRSSSANRHSDEVSPAQRLRNSSRRRTSPLTLGASSGSPVRHLSPSPSPNRLPEIAGPDDDLGFRSKTSTTTVTFFHASVREFFRDEDILETKGDKDAPAIGFNTGAARVHVLKTCLRIFNDKQWFQSQKLGGRVYAIRQYAAWYWQEHLAALDPKDVSQDDKCEIGQQVYRMLVDEEAIAEWSLIYEENDEGLEVLTDKNIKALRTWIGDRDVLAGLTPEAKAWAEASIEQPTGIFQAIGRFYAKAWLDEGFDLYVPTKFCFKIVQSIAYMDSGYKWSDSQKHWAEIALAKRINKATEWAQFGKTAHWHRRVGSTYLTMGMYKEALAHYNEGLKLDKDSVEIGGRKAFCLSKHHLHDEALQLALKCEAAEEKLIADGKGPESKMAAGRWRLYKDQYLAALSFHRVGEQDKSIEYFHKALQSAEDADLGYSERFEPVIGFLEVLATQNRPAEIMKLVQDLSLQASGPRTEQSRLIDFLLSHYSTTLVMELIPKAACINNQADFLMERLNIGIEVTGDRNDALKRLYLRITLGTTLAYKRDIDLAIEIFEQICLVEYRPRGNVLTRQAHAISFQTLATLYKDLVLRVGIHSPEADHWIERLETVQAKQGSNHDSNMPASMLGSDFNAASIYLAHFYRLRGRQDDATALLSALIVESCLILEDDDLRNDKYALENLLRLFVAAGPEEEVNARALAVSMRQLNPDVADSTPGASPVLERQPRPQPKLPDIQSWDRSCARCLEIISPREEFFMCHFCVDSYCSRCLNDAIKVGKDTVVCGPEHEWFVIPPRDRGLHTGELLVDGNVTRFTEWEEDLKQRWEEKGRKVKAAEGTAKR